MSQARRRIWLSLYLVVAWRGVPARSLVISRSRIRRLSGALSHRAPYTEETMVDSRAPGYPARGAALSEGQ